MNNSIMFCEFGKWKQSIKNSRATTCEYDIQNLVIIFIYRE